MIIFSYSHIYINESARKALVRHFVFSTDNKTQCDTYVTRKNCPFNFLVLLNIGKTMTGQGLLYNLFDGVVLAINSLENVSN